MKMTKTSYEKILKAFDANMESIKEYIPKLKESDDYNDFNTKLKNDCARAFLEIGWVCSLYDAEKINDTHLKTAYIKALKELELI